MASWGTQFWGSGPLDAKEFLQLRKAIEICDFNLAFKILGKKFKIVYNFWEIFRKKRKIFNFL